MTITLRNTKGSALTHSELDGNFTDLDGRVTTLENAPASTNTYLASGSVAGNTMTLTLSDASTVSVDVTDLNNSSFAAAPTLSAGVIESFADLTGATGAVDHDCSTAKIFRHTSIAADFTANFTNIGLSDGQGTAIALTLIQGGTAYIPNAVQIGGAAQTILWLGGSAPTGTASGVDQVTFTVYQSSSTYTVLGNLVSYS